MSEQKDLLPLEMVFVRHGQSEANVLQKAEKSGQLHDLPEELRTRPDWEHRLTDLGVEQAKVSGLWIAQNIGEIATHFAARYHSPFVRARETAAHLGGAKAGWRSHNMMYERDWGEFGVTPRAEQAERFPFSSMMKEAAPLFARLEGGESIAETVTMRVDNFRDDLRRRWSNESVLTVTHGDIINAVRYVFEHMAPEEWQAMDRDKKQSISNCSVLWYSRVNPADSEDVRPYVNWRRMVDPNNLSRSPFGGEWQQIPYQSERSGDEILAAVEAFPRLLG